MMPIIGPQTFSLTPVIVARPAAPPTMLPVWNAAVPIPIALTTSATEIVRGSGFSNSFRNASPSPSCVIRPSRALISWRTIVARIENAIVHTSTYAYSAPITLAVVTVPGPTNAAATSAPGPIAFSRSIIPMLRIHIHHSLYRSKGLLRVEHTGTCSAGRLYQLYESV